MDAQARQALPRESAIRLCLRFKARDIPGDPCARSLTVADAFMQQKFERKFDWERDYIYTPAGIDDVEDGTRMKLFMFLDVNKHANSKYETLLCYQVGKGDSMTFTETKFNGVRDFSDMFPWGGRDMRNAPNMKD
ncbi:hypothetical protein P171DRAFT_436627 [Karstenula rhodostoma CBS 690.94]|uniref:Uncharacterized protein n=1 Tax=Karstenula rhodostoma CBS 690.94 TaxID=1392251 RepID=A0A9P4P8J4_9PLEO|nr:hypothetical protein P171DRAFT_436627 [Karstenula rhodostoma CBS 690.94]